MQVSFGPFRFDEQNGLWRGAREVPLPPAVAIRTSPHLRAVAPVLISTRDDLEIASGRADLGRVLVRGRGAASSPHELRVVLEWFSELARLVRHPA